MAFDPVTAVFDLGGKLIDRLWPDPNERDAAKLKLIELQQTGELAQLAAETDLMKGQIEVNKVEAANSSLFVAGWRPFIGWICGGAFAYHFVLAPIIAYMSALHGEAVPIPAFDMDALYTVLLGMLGLGGMRSFDKMKGTSKP